MEKKLRRFCVRLLVWAALGMTLWSVVDDTALRMAACPQEESRAEEAGEAAPVLDAEGRAAFVFPFLEGVLAFLFPGWGK